MNLFEAKLLAQKLMAIHLWPIHPEYTFAFHNKKRSAGTCNYSKKLIMLSKPLTSTASENEVTDTILHEIAHALTPHHGHDHIWRAKAIELGCDGNRCFNDHTKPNTFEAMKQVANYIAVCPNGHEHFAFRKKKVKSACGICCKQYNFGRFDARFILEFKPI